MGGRFYFSLKEPRQHTVINIIHARIQKVLSDGVRFHNVFFLFTRDRRSNCHNKWATIGPLSKGHLDGFLWRADNGPTLNAGLVAS